MFKKKFARIIGRNSINFNGKDKIIRMLYPPNKFKNIHNGEKFITNYFDLKYEGITSNYIDWGVYFYEGLEKGLINYLLDQTKENSFTYFFDIGANAGTASLPFSKSKKIKIICFEPLEYNFLKLTNNYKINNLYQSNTFHQIGLSNKKGEADIYFSTEKENIGTTSLIKDYCREDNEVQKAQLNVLDNLYNLKKEKIIIKIDVEGYEKFVIEGAMNLLKNNSVLLYLETHDKKLIQELININFKTFFPKFYYDKYAFVKQQQGCHLILKNY